MTKRNNMSIAGASGTTFVLLLLVGVFAASPAAAGYREEDGGGGGESPSVDYYRGGYEPGGGGGGGGGNRQLPAILMHKQALQEDGGFQYAFAADNGLRQGESIRPDGSRTGAYSYTDPDGKEISVKYTAGRDGFRIVQGDHVPKAPVSVVPLQQPAAYSAGRSGSGKSNRLFGAPGGPGSQFSRGYDSGETSAYSPSPAYRPKYTKQPQQQQSPQHYRVHEDDDAESPGRYEDDGSSAFDGAGDYSSHSPFRAPAAQTRLGENSHKDGGDRQQPHTFGGGYAFEFTGGGGGGAAPASLDF